MDKRPSNLKRITTKKAAEKFIDQQVKAIQEQVGDKKVLLALSGGVDSSVCAALLIKAIGKQLVCVHVNHGLLRKGEPEQVIEVFRNNLGADLRYVDASKLFLKELKGVAKYLPHSLHLLLELGYLSLGVLEILLRGIARRLGRSFRPVFVKKLYKGVALFVKLPCTGVGKSDNLL